MYQTSALTVVLVDRGSPVWVGVVTADAEGVTADWCVSAKPRHPRFQVVLSYGV